MKGLRRGFASWALALYLATRTAAQASAVAVTFVVVTSLLGGVTGARLLLIVAGLTASILLPLLARRWLRRRLAGSAEQPDKLPADAWFPVGWNLALVSVICIAFSDPAGKALRRRGDWFLGEVQGFIPRRYRAAAARAGLAMESHVPPPGARKVLADAFRSHEGKPLIPTIAWHHPLPGKDRALPGGASWRFGARRASTAHSGCELGHCGVDLPGRPGLAVHAASDGTVQEVREGSGAAGASIVLAHVGGAVRTRYGHLDRIGPRLVRGAAVRGGERIGALARARSMHGRSPHLHFELMAASGDGVRHVDPGPLLRRWRLSSAAGSPPRVSPPGAVGLEEPPGGRFDRFYLRLSELRKRRASRARITFFGASHVAAEVLPGRLRKRLQGQLGNAGPGFVHVGKPWPTYRHDQLEQGRSAGWITERIRGRAAGTSAGGDPLLGVGGISVHAPAPASAWIGPRAGTPPWTGVRLFFLRQPGGGRVEIFADGRRALRLATSGARRGSGQARVAVGGRTRKIELRTSGGEVRLFGADVENGQPGVILDTVGVNGARASTVLRWDEPLMVDQLRRLDPDLVIIAYGTNEINSPLSPARLTANFKALLRRMKRGAPRAACLVLGPPDQARDRKEKGWKIPSRLDPVVALQRRVARRRGCAFWSQRAAMGGPGSIFKWVNGSPPLARKDHIHLTARGYRQMADWLYGALARGWTRYRCRAEKDPAACKDVSPGK